MCPVESKWKNGYLNAETGTAETLVVQIKGYFL